MKNTLIIFLFLATIKLHSQQSEAFVALSGGLSIPFSEYSSQKLGEGCFALPGFEISLSAGLPIRKQLGIALQSGFAMHPVDVSALATEKLQNDPFLRRLTIRSEAYRMLNFMGGPQIGFRPEKRIKLSVAALFGMFASRSPYQLHKTTYQMPGPSYYEIGGSPDRSFAWGLTTLCSYEISSCNELGLKAEYVGTEASFRFRKADGSLRTDNRKINMINISLSMLFKLPDFPTKTRQ